MAISSAQAAVQVTLAWDPNSEPDLAGYKVYYGTSTRNYAVSYDAGKVTTYGISGLQEGVTLYFAATAYDRYGNESDFSEEVVYTTPVANRAPVAQSGTLSTNQNTAATGTLIATDPDGDSLTFSVTTQGTLGTVVITNAATGAYAYTPNAGAKGSDTFTFQVADARGLTSSATVAVTIVAVNHAPVAQNGSLSTPQGTTGSGVLVATDSDGDALTYTLATQPSKGTAVITNTATGSYTYTPNSGVTGTDSFTFQVRDPGNLTSSATVAVTITAVNQPPVASNGALSTAQDTPATSKLVATDANGDTLTYSVVSAAQLGKVALNAATGSFTYTPNTGASGTDTFTFKANDGKADSNVATFTVTINAYVTVMLEAEAGVRTAPMVLASDSTASNGQYIWVRNGKGSITDPLAAGGQAVYTFDVPSAGNYQVWARVMAISTDDNSFFVSMDGGTFVAWHTPLAGKTTWAWGVVTDDNHAEPSSFALTAGRHTLIIKQMEDGAKIDAIAITTKPAWIPETVYADAENGTIDGWDVFDASPEGAAIANVFDEERNSQVIQVTGSQTSNGYRLRSTSYTDWANPSQFVIEWSMKYSETFVVYVEVETNKGYRYFQYEALAKDYLGSSTQVRLGLGTDAKNGEWHTFVRDLQADLARAQTGVTILKVNAFSIRGSGLVDDVKLRATR